jgi:hypothetical protein
MGSAQSSKNSLIAIMSEGMKHGLDTSEFREENRKFSEAAADFIYKSSAATQADSQSITGLLGSFLSERTSKGVETAKTTYDKFQQIATETSGARGAFNFATIMSDKDFDNVSIQDKRLLNRLTPEDLVEGSPSARYIRSKYGISIDTLRKKAVSRGFAAASLVTSPEQTVSRMRDKFTKAGGKLSSIMSYDDAAGYGPAGGSVEGIGEGLDEAVAQLRIGNASLTEKQAQNMVFSQFTGQELPGTELTKKSTQLLGKENAEDARRADVLMEQAGQGAKKFLEDFSGIGQAFDDARRSYDAFVNALLNRNRENAAEIAAGGSGRQAAAASEEGFNRAVRQRKATKDSSGASGNW